ncbi:MAG: hypothetical protein KDA93_03090 [Planctomycetaceae bacterium]|nr:hypothetical protein [Planctomycetaceae bacterium]
MKIIIASQTCLVLVMLVVPSHVMAEVPTELKVWMSEQSWERDTDGPLLSLGNDGEFDDTHLFAPAVANSADGFQLWYCGSRGKVAERVFSLGMASSRDGREFIKHPKNPVFTFGDGKHSVLTPTLLRNPDGTTLREGGRLRMWFSSTWFEGKSGLHTLHETSSGDGVEWSSPSEAELENVYAPTVLKIGDEYRMWCTDVSEEPWKFRHASSPDGQHWDVTGEPVLVIDQAWEQSRLFYPTVLKIDDAYLMWYGSYWTARESTTALGFAVSDDGVTWHKHPGNPVLRPDPDRPWESHYVTSQSVMGLPNGTFRIWYASRKAPPFINKYFAVNTAVWRRP